MALPFAGNALACHDCCDKDQDNIDGEIRTSACVNGQVIATISRTGGGSFAPGTSPVSMPGPRTVNGSGVSTFNYSPNSSTPGSPRSAIVQITPGAEYSVQWAKVGNATVNSLHTLITPRNLPTGHKLQIDNGDGKGWREQNHIDHVGSAAANPPAAVHKFRVIPPIGQAGKIGGVMMTDTRFSMRSNPNPNGLALIVNNADADLYPDYEQAGAKVTMNLGSTIENGVPVSAGNLIFRRKLWQDSDGTFTITPKQLAYEGPANVGVVFISDGGGNIRQIKSLEVLADVVTISSTKFEVRMYSFSDVGNQPGPGQPYAVSGTPLSKVVFERLGSFSVAHYDGSFPYGVRITRYEHGEEISQTDLGGRYTISGSKVRFLNVRRQGNEIVGVVNNLLNHAPGFAINVGPFTQIVENEALHYRIETRQTHRDGQLTAKSERKYILHSIGGWGGNPLGGYGDLMVSDKQFFGGEANEFEETRQWINIGLQPHGQLNPPGSNTFNAGAFGKPAFVLYPDGGWTRYFYNEHSQLIKTYRPYKGTPTIANLFSANDTNCIVETYDAVADPYSIPTGGSGGYTTTPNYEAAIKKLEGTAETKINNVTTGRSMAIYSKVTVNGHPALRITQRNYYSSSGYVTEITDTYHHTAPQLLRGRTAAVNHSTGERHTYGYEAGTFNPVTRAFTPVAGGLDLRQTVTQGTEASPNGTIHKTTRERSIIGPDGQLHRQELQIYTGGTNYETATVTDHFHDDHGHLIRTEKDGRIVRESSTDGLTTVSIDESGIETTTVRDELGRTLTEAKTGGPTTIYTPVGPTTTIQTGTLSRSFSVDLKGRSISETDETGATIATIYPNGGRDREVTWPGGLKTQTTKHPGGMVISETNVTGTKIVPRHYSHTVVTGSGNQTTRVNLATSNSPRWSETTEDWLGHTKSTSAPSPTGSGNVTSDIGYNDAGQLTSETLSANTGLAPRRYQYDSLGRLFREGIDLNTNNLLDLNGLDTILEYDQRFEKISGLWYRVEETREYRTDSNGTPTVIALAKSRLHGSAGGLADHTISVNADNLTVESSTIIDRVAKTRTVTTTANDATGVRTQTYINGLLAGESSPTGHFSYQYDALERLETTTDHRAGTVTTRAYHPTTGQLESVTDHLGNATAWFYHPAGHKNAGQISRIRNAALKDRYFSYADSGLQTHTWGAAVHPAKRAYTVYGELQTLTTYRGGSGWTGATWPTATEGTGDTTTWLYYPATGLLQHKEDAQGRKTAYTWRANGHVHVRTWQRNVTATHTYNGAGLLLSIAYNDGTPTATITRHRTGQTKTLADAAGLHTYAYTAAGRIDTETIGGSGPHSGIVLDYSYGLNGVADTLAITAGATSLYQTSRTFHPVSGHLHEVESGDASARYRYHAKSSLVHQIAFSHDDQPSLVHSRAYDELDRLKDVTHFTTGSLDDGIPMKPVAYTGYKHDELHRRTHATELDGTYWHYAYNDRGEVTDADKKLPAGTLMAGKQYRHTYDNIGNITSKQSGGTATGTGRRTFTTPANSLNQYAGYATPATFDVLGIAPATPVVKVNGVNATYQGNHFRSQVTASNGNANGAWSAVSVVSGATTETGHRYIAPATFTPAYDQDGNLTDDGEWDYTWDAENRLKTVTRTQRAQNAGAPYRRLEFTYDALHRCVQRREYHASAGPVVKTERYLYDGWNRVATLNGSNQSQQRFTWGIDLSGGMQGAGGVGGLLWIEDVPTGSIHIVCMDGNGNVTALVNAITKQATARYDYSPFGETIRQSGPYATANPYRFSTKPQDAVTGLLYYGYRHYKSAWNTWINRDPIEEDGGLNLYGLCYNAPTNWFDILGKQPGPYHDWANQAPSNWAGKGSNEIDRANRQFDDALKNFLSGKGPSKLTYGENSPWTRQLMKKPVYDRMRKWIQSESGRRLKDGTIQEIINTPLSWDDSADDDPWYTPLKDLANYIVGFELKSSGSKKGKFTITDVSRESCTVSYSMVVTDEFRWGSATRVPGTDRTFWPDPIKGRGIGGSAWLPPSGTGDNPFGEDGVLRNLEIEWNWNETLPIQIK